MVSKEVFCKALALIQEQEKIDQEFSDALQKVGNGSFVFGTENRYFEALLLVLKAAVNDRYSYIEWWLYEGAPDYKIWSEDEKRERNLKEPGALYDYIVSGE